MSAGIVIGVFLLGVLAGFATSALAVWAMGQLVDEPERPTSSERPQ